MTSHLRTTAWLLLFPLGVFLLLGVRVAAQAAQPSTYSVGPQDVIAISVFGQPSLSGRFTVEADGTFTFPLIGRVKAGGLTLRDVESELRQMLAQGYLKNPQVSVAVEQYRSQKVFVVGEVRTPGTYPLSGDMTLIEALARAGSTTERARTEALIVRAGAGAADGPHLPDEAGASEVLHVDLNVLQRGALSRNVLLRDGDTVFVPRAEMVFVFGQVKNPGGYPIQSDMTVLQALSLAGGTTDRGTASRVRVVRIVGDKRQEIKVKLDDLVHAGDTIIVPERFF